MGRIILVTGGCRSGKSRYAQLRAEETPGERIYLATCPVLDDEMRDRVTRHRSQREGRGWTTIEPTLDLAAAVASIEGGAAVVDCATLWISNLMYDAYQRGIAFDEDDAARRSEELTGAARRCPGDLFVVTNEVGMGIVPENEVARRFRDLAGRCNQTLAARADEVILMVSGIAVAIKGDRATPGRCDAAS